MRRSENYELKGARPQKPFHWIRQTGKTLAESWRTKIPFRLKLLLLISLVMGSLLAVVYGVSSATILAGFLRVEDQDVHQHAKRAAEAFEERIKKIDYVATDWSAWDDAYTFVRDRNAAFRSSNLIYTGLERLNLDMILFMDPQGRIVYGSRVDRHRRKLTPISGKLAQYFSTHELFFRHRSPDCTHRGFISLPDGVLLVSAHPILTSEGKGPIRGTLIFAHFLNGEDLNQLEDVTRLSIGIDRCSPRAPGEEFWIERQGDDSITGFGMLKDLYGSPNLRLSVIMPRSIYRQGHLSMSYFLLCLSALGLMGAVGSLEMIDKLIASWRRQQEAEVDLQRVVTRARCILWSADVSEEEDAFDWDLQVSDEAAAQEIFPLEVFDGQTYAQSWTFSRSPEDAVAMDATSRAALLSGDGGYAQEFRATNRFGLERWLREEVTLEKAGPGRWHMVGICIDITDRKRMEEAIHHSEERFRALVRNASDVVAILSPEGVIRYISPAAERLCGVSPKDLEGTSIFRLLFPADLPHAEAIFERVCESPGGALTTELRLRHTDDSFNPCEVHLSHQLDEPGVQGIILTARDIAERKKFEEQLAYQAFHDPLTGLPNRALFMDRLERALTRSGRKMTTTAVLFLDLDGFKVINDSLGHEAGDRLLVDVARRLEEQVRASDTVARLGGDEFTILLEDLEGPSEARIIAGRIEAALSQPVRLQDREVFTTASMGIAFQSLEAYAPEDLLRDADTAMYQAKKQGKARYMVFNPGMNTRAVERLELETDLRRAIERGEFCLHYQPILRLDTGAMDGVEALVRWEHPVRGLVPPSAFIPIAEETGLIVHLGRWVLEEACRQMKQWDDVGSAGKGLTVSVNLSARQLQQEDLVEEIVGVLSRNHLKPHRLKLEITESVMMQDVESILDRLRQLKALGIRLAVDDFGTGYSSMSYLSLLPIHILKIDRAFVKRIGDGTGDSSIVQTMISLAKALNLEVVSEGVETGEQLDWLKELGCDQGQGFYFAKPLTKEDLGRWIAGEQVNSLPPPDIARLDAV